MPVSREVLDVAAEEAWRGIKRSLRGLHLWEEQMMDGGGRFYQCRACGTLSPEAGDSPCGQAAAPLWNRLAAKNKPARSR